MKSFLFTLVLLVFGSAVNAQDSLAEGQKESIDHFIDLVRNNQVKELADLAKYPIQRPNPIPNLENREDFIRYYPILFDEAFRNRILEEGGEDVISRSGMMGLLNGLIWLDVGGEILSIHNNSAEELALQGQLEAEAAAGLHPSVKEFSSNMYACDCGEYKVRLDQMAYQEYRLAIWGEGAPLSEKPLVVSKDLVIGYHGSMGGTRYAVNFPGDEEVIILDNFRMGESEEATGLFLTLKGVDGNGEEVRVKCGESK